MSAACELDHLIIGAHTLEQGAAFIEDLLGVKPQAGGRHLAMGTHNRVLKLGPRAYLEIIAIDPAGEAPPRPRWFGLDDEKIRAQLRERPRLLTWAARTQDIDKAVKRCPIALGRVHSMARGTYQWRITIPDDGALICDGLVPALIQWDCAKHPADSLEDRGYELASLDGEHPEAAAVTAALGELGLGNVINVDKADNARLAATVRGARGVCTIVTRNVIP
jgi:glyoxalase-like protein